MDISKIKKKIIGKDDIKNSIIFDTEEKLQKTLKELKKKDRYDNCLYVHDLDIDGEWDISIPRFKVQEEIYDTVTSIWDKEMIPFVTEALYLHTISFRRNSLRNLIAFMICDCALDDNYMDENVIRKTYLISRFIERAEIDWQMNEISWEWVEKAKYVACKMHGKKVPYHSRRKKIPDVDNWMEYYEAVVKPLMRMTADYTVWEKMCDSKIDFIDWKMIASKLRVPEHLDDDVVQFFIEDYFRNYVFWTELTHYNPIWLFGSKCYYEILKDIWSWDWKAIKEYNEKRWEEKQEEMKE